MEKLKKKLNLFYNQHNKRKYVHPDPLEFLYQYKEIRNREIVGLIASSLAYGRVAQILKSVAFVLDIMNPSPYLFLKNSTYKSLNETFEDFTHRFATQDHIAALLFGIKNVISEFGSLHKCFLTGFSEDDKNVISAMTFFSQQLIAGKNNPGHLVAMPEKGSACKRMNLFLRWMIRKDRVDPGGWTGIPLSKLIIPLDTHMHRIGLALNLTKRKQASMRTALEITSCFKKLVPDDPVKYDFVLTRLGIRNDMVLTLTTSER
ncbi:MAG: TIGR02757 family protein [Deltaproteobacteria bacterium]|nr:TIGR02757 family protein [Deltaproteobacteria bacterium]MBW2661567.1 TIGR02757 family protein [Deltaproteobacteria bacterium]